MLRTLRIGSGPGRRRDRRATAWLACLALLLELFLGLPASLQMAADPGAGTLVVCTATGPELVPGDQRPGDPLGHRHDGCILCHGGLGAALLADPAPAVVSPATIGLLPPPPAALPALLPAPPRAYASRAPPATVRA